MLDLFDQNGHLTDKALQALTWEEDLNELQRLEISEHLSFLPPRAAGHNVAQHTCKKWFVAPKNCALSVCFLRTTVRPQ